MTVFLLESTILSIVFPTFFLAQSSFYKTKNMDFKTLLSILVLGCLCIGVNAQTVIDFEELTLEGESFYNGADESGGFTSGDAFFGNTYDTTFSFWTGFAYSNMTDNMTGGFGNQYSAYAGSGAESSSNYIVGYVPAHLTFETPQTIESMSLTNNSYAAFSMLEGDAYAKKFGGETGDDPDFFLLDMVGYLEGDSVGMASFYLADYRFENNTEDYIVQDWTEADVNSLGSIDSLVFRLSSSDVGEFGMNTPAYFCIDNIVLSPSVGLNEMDDLTLNVYPNPTTDFIQIQSEILVQSWSIYDLKGNLVLENKGALETSEIDVQGLLPNTYILKCETENGSKIETFVKM